ncbi:MAG: GNAT family N-acetyltransferase, partial [Cetobacterium sp.]
MYKIKLYNDSFKKKWDEFINRSKNGTFLLRRDYIEYHKDRFPDTSFLVFDTKENIIAVIAG